MEEREEREGGGRCQKSQPCSNPAQIPHSATTVFRTNRPGRYQDWNSEMIVMTLMTVLALTESTRV